MPTLLEVQRAMQRSLLARDAGEAAAFIVADGPTPSERLAIYRSTVIGTLTTALRLSYPAVFRLVGAEFFEGAARIFIDNEPPHGAYLDEYGAAFPEFLARFPPATSLSYLPEAARLEWAVSRAFHAPDNAALDLSCLSEVDPTSRDRIVFVPHPSVGLVQAGYPVDAIWRGLGPGRGRHGGDRPRFRAGLAVRPTVRDRGRCLPPQRARVAVRRSVVRRPRIAGSARRSFGL